MSEDEIEPMLRMTRTAWDDLLLEGLNSHRAARLWQEEIARKLAGADLPEDMADLRTRVINGLNSAHLSGRVQPVRVLNGPASHRVDQD